MKAIVNTNLNERTELPSVNAPVYNYYKPGDEINIVEIINGEPYEGNKVWYKLDNGRYVWSGGVEGMETLVIEPRKENIFNPYDFYWLHDYGIPTLWDFGLTGKGVKVAVLDSGLSLPHVDLIIPKSKCADLSNNSTPNIQDKSGHGTHCTGIIKASNNGIGVTGIAHECDLFFGKITHDKFKDSFKRLKRGMMWAIKMKVDIVSISLGRLKDKEHLQQVLQDFKYHNIIPVCAGGNMIPNITKEDDILYPAKYEECISVGAVDQSREPTQGTLKSPLLDIGAPGTAIMSTFINNTYEKLSGTSQAAPFVTGVLALIIQYCKENQVSYSIDTIKFWLQECSDKNEKTPFAIINPLKLFNHLKP